MSICPISFAIVGWNCSLVFHSVDKVTSFMVHVMPGKIISSLIFIAGNALAWVQRVHEPAVLWDITVCIR